MAPTRVNALAGVSFTIGGTLFAIGALMAQLGLGSVRDDAVVYLVGGVFFSLGGYLSVLLAGRGPGRLSAVVLFVGTLFFAVSLVAAFASGLTPRQSNGWIWLPDMAGCVCFLVSGRLALVEVGRGRIWRVVDDLEWWVAGVNQLGSILFLLAGLAAFVRPATSAPLNEALVNWGTFGGAVCFAVAGILQLRVRPQGSP
ncbi:MAG: hypothetical protein EON52_19285 [Actinomycetales bacterium]|nr:MAG: hypothetical protein EON52_19285 [Actinomycetales bacterium]